MKPNNLSHNLIQFFSLAAAPQRPVAKRKVPPKPQTHPQAEALYDYQASDTDEISLNAGEKLSVIREGRNQNEIKYQI